MRELPGTVPANFTLRRFSIGSTLADRKNKSPRTYIVSPTFTLAFHLAIIVSSISSAEANGLWLSRMMLKCPKCWSDVK